ncbi:MAG: DUF6512 family protein [Oscillospiraceae bacterium]|jgi:hypothetical protein
MVPRKYMVACLLATLFGVGLHFLYSFFPNPVTALFSPVRESVWEHVKLVYWSYLLVAFFLVRGEGPHVWRIHLTTLLFISLFQTVCGYIYHIVLCKGAFSFDLSLYVLSMGVGFALSCFLRSRGDLQIGKLLPALAVALGMAILLFTFYPPGFRLFADLSAVHTWAVIPY